MFPKNAMDLKFKKNVDFLPIENLRIFFLEMLFASL